MSSPTRFPSGVTNVRKDNILGYYGLPDPTSWHTYFNDFDTFAASDWVITTTEGGAGSASEAVGDIDGGALVVTNDDADNDSDFLQLAGESFQFAAGKRVIFKSRFKVSDATQSDFVMGLQITDTTPLAVSDGVFFQKDDGDASLDLHVTKNSTSTDATAIATLSNDTFVEVGFEYDGASSLSYYVDGVKKGTLATTNLPDDEILTVSFGIQNGEAAAKSMSVDYILSAKER